jgi:hypothetical protein
MNYYNVRQIISTRDSLHSAPIEIDGVNKYLARPMQYHFYCTMISPSVVQETGPCLKGLLAKLDWSVESSKLVRKCFNYNPEQQYKSNSTQITIVCRNTVSYMSGEAKIPPCTTAMSLHIYVVSLGLHLLYVKEILIVWGQLLPPRIHKPCNYSR